MLLLIGFSILTRLAFRGWIPHDDGTLAQAASRVLDGETPHVDFHDTYGGLQAYAHAGAFQLFGESLRTLRLANLVVAAIAALSSFALVRRVQPPVVAAAVGVTLLLVGFAVYPASMPSWWNAALGLASAYLVMRWLDSRRDVFLLAAGTITGISFLIKSTAAYAGAGIALFLLMLASQTSSKRKAYLAVGAILVLVFAALLARSTSLETIVLMLLPLSIVVGVGFRKQPVSRDGHGDVSAKAPTLFALAAAAPVLIFAMPYIWSGNADALIIGWFRLPQLRFDQAAWGISLSVAHLAVLALLAALVLLLYRRVGVGPTIGTSAALLVLVAAFNWDAWWGLVLTFILVAPLGISAGVLRIGWRKGLTREQLLCSLMLATFAFIQFPQANSIYALYLVPWIVTALGVWFTGRSRASALVGLSLLVSVIVVIQLERDLLYISTPLDQPVALVPLDLDRGGIEVPEQHRFYVDLADQLQSHAGSPIYAGPDSPEIYFLSNTVNPTPVLFDFLAWDWGVDDLERTIRSGELTAAVVNTSPDFSGELSEHTLTIVQDEFPSRTTIGWFDIYEEARRK
jgi:hypothetical protein